MNRKVQILFLSIVSLISGPWTSELTAMYVGNIKFPHVLEKVPPVRAYFRGEKFTCSINNESKQTTFSISSDQRNTPLYILVTKHVHWGSKENTIKYLKTDINKSYKLYLITPHESLPGKKQEDTEAHWGIQEITLDTDGKLLDEFNTIIVIFNPDWIDTLEGGNSITLPNLRVYSNILERVGTERELHAMAEELLLASLDSDSIHKKIQHTVKPYYQLKTVLALTT